VRDEIRRVLPAGDTVWILGGSLAISTVTDARLRDDGYVVRRLAGSDRYQTAVAIANALGDPSTVIEVTGDGFADALAAAPAASAVNGALLLTSGSQQSAATATYIDKHAGTRYAVGGPASAADPSATTIAGSDRYETALQVTERFISHPSTLGFATGMSFPDALAGGPVTAQQSGGLLLVPSCGSIPTDIADYLASNNQSVNAGWLFGGGTAVGDSVLEQLDQALN
jgi:putative cell wall-binding protein